MKDEIFTRRRRHLGYLTIAITLIVGIGVLSELTFPYEILSESIEVDHWDNYQLNQYTLFFVAIGLLVWILLVGFYAGRIKGEEDYEKFLQLDKK